MRTIKPSWAGVPAARRRPSMRVGFHRDMGIAGAGHATRGTGGRPAVSYRTPSGQIEVAAWVRNLTNKANKTFAFDASTFNNTSIYFVGDPRMWGLNLTINF